MCPLLTFRYPLPKDHPRPHANEAEVVAQEDSMFLFITSKHLQELLCTTRMREREVLTKLYMLKTKPTPPQLTLQGTQAAHPAPSHSAAVHRHSKYSSWRANLRACPYVADSHKGPCIREVGDEGHVPSQPLLCVSSRREGGGVGGTESGRST